MLFLSVVCALVATVLSSSEPQREVILFDKVDNDKNGQLSVSELDNIFLAFDVNHDQEVTASEFENDWTVLYNLGAPIEARTLFTKADTNDDGHITSDDLPEIFTYFDSNGDSFISLDEFLTQWGDLKNAPIDNIIVPVGTTSTPKPSTTT
ncbi:calmodulin-like protein 7 [Pecten maximus]|uniref:calmodulin-like protein 7 n=1 Tax=Pecten maximus TaxID=6579 RepID=UPI0014582BAD|nr:calmodulin-like protein 7 [Pecten maximus]